MDEDRHTFVEAVEEDVEKRRMLQYATTMFIYEMNQKMKMINM